jgi:hypothetical protein
MGFIKRIREHFQHIVDCFNCGCNGHGDIVVIDRYDKVYREKNFKGLSLKNLSYSKPYVETICIEKCACRRCGETFLRHRIIRV